MTNIFKIEVKNKEVADKMPALYFETQEAAEAVINTFNSMVVKDKKLIWKCSIIKVYSKEDAYKEFFNLSIETLPEKE